MMGRCENHFPVNGFSPEEIETAAREGRLLILELEVGGEAPSPPAGRTGAPAIKGGNRLGFEEWMEVVCQGLELGVRRIVLYGTRGPLSDPGTVPLIRFIRERECDVELSVRGEAISSSLARELFDRGVNIVLPWGGFDPDAPDVSENGEGTLLDSIESRSQLIEAGYPGAGRTLGLRAAVDRSNLEEIPNMWRWARERGWIPCLEPGPYPDGAAEAFEAAVSFEQTKRLFETLSRIDSEEYHLHWQPHPPLAGQRCDRLLYSLAVRAGGDVTPCAGLDLPVGNVRESSLGQVIRQSQVIHELRGIRSRIKGYCRTCERAADCYGCRSSAFWGTDDYLESDPGCWLKRSPAEDATRFEVKDLIPHRGDMNLIEGIAWRDKKKIILSMTVPADNIFIDPNGTVAPLALIEMLAQLCAAEHSYKLRLGRGQQISGFLIGIDQVRFRKPVRAGDRIDLAIWKVLELNEIHRVRGEIYRGTALAGQAELTLFEAAAGIPQSEAPVPKTKTPGAVFYGNRYPWADGKDRVGREILRSLRELEIRPRESAEAAFAFQPDFIGFSGHFPGRPLVPGVVIIYLGWLLAEMCVQARLEVRFIKKAKFIKPIRPLDEVDVIVRMLESDATPVVWFSAEVLDQGDLIAKHEIGLVRT